MSSHYSTLPGPFQLAGLDAHFGASLHRMEPMLLCIAWSDEAPPEWLRGVSRLSDVPRFRHNLRGEAFDLSHLGLARRARRVRWVVESLAGPWSYDPGLLILATDTDAVLFRLRWSSDCDD